MHTGTDIVLTLCVGQSCVANLSGLSLKTSSEFMSQQRNEPGMTPASRGQLSVKNSMYKGNGLFRVLEILIVQIIA